MVRWSSILGLKPPDIAVMLIDKTIQILSRKKRKREEDNTYVLDNKHGHCDVHVLLHNTKSKMIEIYLLTYTQRDAFHDLPGMCYGHNYMKRKITKTNVYICYHLCFPKALVVLRSMYVHVILSIKKFSYA